MIVIIGAGLAGLAAAQKLKESGLNDFIIVEAQDYVGGRIKQVPQPPKLGHSAEWLYGQDANPIYQWLNSQAYISEPSKKAEVTFDGLFATQDGQEIPIERVQPILGGASQAKKMLFGLNPFVPDNKLLVNNFKAALNQITEHCSQNATDEERKIAKAVKEWVELRESIHNFCENFDDLSMRAYSSQTNYDKDKLLVFNWKLVVDHMAKTIDMNRIYLNTPVDHIEYSTESVRVLLANGMEFVSDHVLVTVPISVIRKAPWLKTPYSFIEPKLSEARQTLMDCVGFGPVTKIFMTFNCAQIPPRLKGLKLLWTCEPEEVELPGWTKDIIGFEEEVYSSYSYQPQIVARVGRGGSQEVERCSDSELGTIFLKVIRLFMPGKPRLTINTIWVSRWTENRYIGGASTYPSIRSDEHDISPAWDPICVGNHAAGDVEPNETLPRILFAGEATAGDHCGTAHGAIMSGWREAERLLKFIAPKQPKSEPKYD